MKPPRENPAQARLRLDLECDTPVYVQIMDQIRRLASDGILEAGVEIPPVRRLAADLEINPNTVSKAYQLLEREGVIETRPRRGCFIAAQASRHAQQARTKRLDEILDGLASESRRLGVAPGDLMEALRKRLGRVSDEEWSGPS